MKPAFLLYDRGQLTFDVPEHWTILEPRDPPGIGDVSAAVHRALEVPISCDPLLTIARRADPAKPAVIVISDITRAIPNEAFLPAILETLRRAGFADERITILIATGMHRPSTPAERVELLGTEISRRYRVLDHRADDSSTLTDLPNRSGAGSRVRINSAYHGAGLRILTGFIEPHFMAGFSGGRKTICPGLVDLATLQKFHGYAILADPRSRIGRLDGNPCHREALEVARMVAPDFILNVTVNAAGQITGVFAGDMEKAHAAGVAQVRATMTVRADRPFDVVFASGGGYPLDTTLYQTGKGMVVAGEYVKPGGRVIVASGCRYGPGSSAFCDILFRYRDYQTFLSDIAAREETELDQWGLQMQARVLERVGLSNLILLCDHIPLDDLRRCHVTPAADVVGAGPAAEQVRRLICRLGAGDLRVGVLPRGPYLLPEVADP